MAYTMEYIDMNPQRWVYVTIGDGELNEGNIWEAAMFAGKQAAQSCRYHRPQQYTDRRQHRRCHAA